MGCAQSDTSSNGGLPHLWWNVVKLQWCFTNQETSRKEKKQKKTKSVFSCMSRPNNKLIWPLWKDNTYKHIRVSDFVLRPPQASRDSSEVGTADLLTSLCRVRTVWATHYDPSMERWVSPECVCTCWLFCSRTNTSLRLIWRYSGRSKKQMNGSSLVPNVRIFLTDIGQTLHNKCLCDFEILAHVSMD